MAVLLALLCVFVPPTQKRPLAAAFFKLSGESQ
jgi:hypothetical protein